VSVRVSLNQIIMINLILTLIIGGGVLVFAWMPSSLDKNADFALRLWGTIIGLGVTALGLITAWWIALVTLIFTLYYCVKPPKQP
jgi:hypothetical protein